MQREGYIDKAERYFKEALSLDTQQSDTNTLMG